MEIYFITDDEIRFVKIGVVRNWGLLNKRLKDLQCGCPLKLHIFSTRPGSFSDEKDLHRMFSHSRLHGEWFKLTADLWYTMANRLRNQIWHKPCGTIDAPPAHALKDSDLVA